MNVQQAEAFVKQVAIQSFGSKAKEGANGGAGSIGMIGGRPVKFNTHWQERVGKATPEMIKSSNDLRKMLGQAVAVLTENRRLGLLATEDLAQIYEKLGINEDGELMPQQGLLSRKVAAEVVHLLDSIRDSDEANLDSPGFFSYVDKLAKSSKGVDTHFSAVQQRTPTEELSAQNAQFRMEPWKMNGPVAILQQKHVEHALNFSQIEFDNIMDGPNQGFGSQLLADIGRGGCSYSFNGVTIDVPKGLMQASKEEQTAFMAKFKEHVSKVVGGNENLLKFYGNFAHQGCHAVYSQIKSIAHKIGDPLPFYLGKGTVSNNAHVDISKIGNNKFRFTVSEEVHGPNTMFIIHDDGSPDMLWWNEPSKDDWYSYEYTLDIDIDKAGRIKLSVNEPPVERVCVTTAPIIDI